MGMKIKSKEMIPHDIISRWQLAQKNERNLWLETGEDESYYLTTRTEWLKRWPILLQNISVESSILDVACGGVPILHVLPRTALMVATDPLNDEYLKKYPRKDYIKYETSLAEKLPYDDNSFDFVFCLNALDHTLDPRQALKEMCRVLAPGGMIGLDFMNSSPLLRFLVSLGYRKHLAEFHPHEISYAFVLETMNRCGCNEVIHLDAQPPFTWKKFVEGVKVLSGRKELSKCQQAISSVSMGTTRMLMHNCISVLDRFFYSFAPKSFSYTVEIVIRKEK